MLLARLAGYDGIPKCGQEPQREHEHPTEDGRARVSAELWAEHMILRKAQREGWQAVK